MSEYRIVELEMFSGDPKYQVQEKLSGKDYWKTIYTGTLDKCKDIKQERLNSSVVNVKVVE